MFNPIDVNTTALIAERQRMNTIADNLANVNTTGFKKSKIEFQDLLYETTRAPGAQASSSTQLPTGLQIDNNDRVYVVDSFNHHIEVFHYYAAAKSAEGRKP